MKIKNLMDEENVNCSVWYNRYPINKKQYQETLYPCIFGMSNLRKNANWFQGGDLRIFLATNDAGVVFYWKGKKLSPIAICFLDKEQLESNSGGFLKGHFSPISKIVISKSQDIFFTSGKYDNCFIEWKG